MSRVRRLAVWTVRIAIALALIVCQPGPGPSKAGAPHAPVAAASRLSGAQPFLVILCKFADISYEPQPPAFFRSLLFGAPPSLDDYWRQVSYGNINLEGSRVLEWRGLAKRSDEYRNADRSVRLDEVGADCMGTVLDDIAARPRAALVLVFNSSLDGKAYAAQACVETDAGRMCRSAIWLWRLSSEELTVWAHEMGHVFGLHHSANESGSPYTDDWDIMGSDGSCQCAQQPSRAAEHPTAWQKLRLGWIPAGREYRASRQGTATVELRGLAEPVEDGYLAATIEDFRGVGYGYVVEARTLAGYDSHLTSAAVVIHRVEPDGDPHPIHLMRHPGDVRDSPAASAWLPGAEFRDDSAGILMSVDARTTTGFRVTLTTGNVADAPSALEVVSGDICSLQTIRSARGVKLIRGPTGVSALVGGRVSTSSEMLAAIHAWRAGRGWQGAEPIDSAWTRFALALPELCEISDGARVLVGSALCLGSSATAATPYMEPGIWAGEQSDLSDWDNPLRLDLPVIWGGAVTPVLGSEGARAAAAWVERAARGASVRLSMREDTGRWSPAAEISDADRPAVRAAPSIAVDAEGNVGAVWIEVGPTSNEVWSAFLGPGRGGRQNQPVFVAGDGRATNPRLAVDGRGNWHAVWTQLGRCPGGSAEYASILAAQRPRDGTWSDPVILATDLDGGSKIAPAVAVTPDGIVFAAWTAYDVGRPAVYLAKSAVTGQWSAAQRIALTHAAELEAPALSAGANGPALLAWLSSQEGDRRLNAILLSTPR